MVNTTTVNWLSPFNLFGWHIASMHTRTNTARPFPAENSFGVTSVPCVVKVLSIHKLLWRPILSEKNLITLTENLDFSSLSSCLRILVSRSESTLAVNKQNWTLESEPVNYHCLATSSLSSPANFIWVFGFRNGSPVATVVWASNKILSGACPVSIERNPTNPLQNMILQRI